MGQHTQRGQGPWCVPQTHREKAEELGLSQAHPSGLQRPREAAGTCPVGKRVHGRVVRREWAGADRCASEGSQWCCWRRLPGAEAHTQRRRDLRPTLEAEASGVTVELDGGEDGRAALGVGSGESVAGGVGHQGRSPSQKCWGLRSAYNHSTQ